MRIDVFRRLSESLMCLKELFISEDELPKKELNEDLNAVLSIDKENEMLLDSIQKIERAISLADSQKYIEAVALARVSIMNIESAFSNLADSMEELVVVVRDSPRRVDKNSVAHQNDTE